MTGKPPWRVGHEVYATRRVTEGGGQYTGNNDAEFPDPDYIHAETGDLGLIEYVDHEGYPTVRFRRTGTATIVDARKGKEIAFLYHPPTNMGTN